MGSYQGEKPPHFILVPLMAQGHTIPMLDLAHLLAGRGAHATFVTTPVNAARIRPTIERARASGLPIRFLTLDFPCAAAGLPDGCENFDLITNQDHYLPFVDALPLLGRPLELYIQSLDRRPSCIISDSCHWWTADIACRLSIPRFIFHGPSCFYLLATHNIRKHDAYSNIADDHQPIVIPELPHKVLISKAQEPGSWFETPGWETIREKAFSSERTADGVVVNTFHELEPQYLESYRNELGKPVLPIGPFSLCNDQDAANKGTRGNKAAITEHQVVSWLDSKQPNSVLLVSFGSLVQKGASQLIEIGRGLEASGCLFIWVIKEAEKSKKVEEWMNDGFLERTKGRGLMITGWAPQVVILSHPAIGGFLTHCGWNSTLEAVAAGVPMITWPHIADQFLNERLVVDVLGIGVEIGVKEITTVMSEGSEEEEEGVVVKKEKVEEVVVRLMEGGGQMRRKAAELGEKAHEALKEGGSSYENLGMLIELVSRD